MMIGSQTLREAREREGLTQQALAERTGLSLRTVYGIEAGGRPSLNTLHQLCNALRLTTEERAVVFGAGAWPTTAGESAR